MLTLYQFAPVWGLLNASPFCMKLEVYMRLANVPYQTQNIGDPRKGPLGKLPYIQDGTKTLSDSTRIIDYLKAAYGNPLDQDLTPQQKSQSLAMQRLVEEHLYWIMVYARWIDPAGWVTTKSAYFEHLPKMLQWFLPDLLRKNQKKTLRLQGIGRHEPTKIYQMGFDDLDAISRTLSDKDYFFGEKPCGIDAVLYGFLANILYVPIDSPLKKHVQTLGNLSNYCGRMKGITIAT